jgi:hypothetical protein
MTDLEGRVSVRVEDLRSVLDAWQSTSVDEFLQSNVKQVETKPNERTRQSPIVPLRIDPHEAIGKGGGLT